MATTSSLSTRWFVRMIVLACLSGVTVPVANAVQTIRITKINGVVVPPDEVFVPNPPNDFFDIEWEAIDTDCNHGVSNMVTNVDGNPQTSSGGSGFSGIVTLDQGAFPTGCRHSAQIVANFRRPGSCLVLTTSVTSVAGAFWSSPYKDCVGPPKSCQEGAGQVGQPCDVATGKMFHEMIDLEIQGPLPIRFVRRYDSQSTSNGSLGFGWRHSYSMRVASAGSTRQIFTDAQGRQVYFNRLSTGVWDSNRIEHLSLSQGTPPWRVTDKQQTRYDFDGSGNLTSIQDRNGNTLSFGYTGSDLTSISDAFGRQISLVYSGGHLQTITAGSRTVTYTYTVDNLTRVDFPDGTFVTYEYLDPNEAPPKHNLTAAKDALGNVIESHSYYATDKIHVTQSDAGNYAYTLDYDTPSAGKTRVTNSRGFQTNYTLHNFSGLITQSDGPGCTSCGGGTTTTLAYDSALNVTDITDGRGVLTHMTYDGQGNVLTRAEGSGARTWTFTYEAHGFPTSITVPSVGTGACLGAHPNKIVTNTYRLSPANGDLMERKIEGCQGPNLSDFFTNIVQFDYDSHGQLAMVNGPRTVVPDDVTTYLYYSDGDPDTNRRARRQRITNALGHQTNFASHDGSRAPYDLFGNVRSVIDANDIETQYEYDASDRVTAVTLPADAITTENQYDAVGNLHRVRLPNCVQTGVSCAFSLEYVHDTVNRLKEIHDAVGNKIIYTYDTEGNRTREEHQDTGATVQKFTNFKYDEFNRLQYTYFTATVPEAPGSIFSKYTYFNDGTLQLERDPEGHVTAFDYDALKRPLTVTQTVGVTNLVTTYVHDVQDNLSSVLDPRSLLTTYTNSDMGWPLSMTSPDTGTTAYVYDPAGNLITSTDAIPVVVNRSYDSLNRPTAVSYPGANNPLNVAYTYDAADLPSGTFFNVGRRTGMTDPSGASAYHYNRRGLLKKEDKTIGSRTFTTQFDYDKTGNLTQVLYPTESPLLRQGEVNYQYDAADRVSTVTTKVNGTTTPVANTFSYLPFGPRTGMTFGNTLADVRTYGALVTKRYQLATWTVGSLLGYTHTFNNDLNLTSRTDDVDPDPTKDRAFGYDEIHRLTQASGPWGPGTACTGSVTYIYDLNGNRSCKGELAATNYSYTASTNRIATSTGAEPASYSSNNDGNITGDGAHTYQYSQANRLATVDSGATAAYTYDGDGRRVIKVSGNTTNYFYDPNGRLLTEFIPATGTGRDYLYLQSEPLARLDWTVTESDLSGSPGPLLVAKASPNVHLDWTNATGSGNSYVVRRKTVVNPNDKTFTGSSVIAVTTDPTRALDDPVLTDANRYDYKVLRKTANETLFFYHADHLGTPIAMTDGLGVSAWRAEFKPFGDGTPTGSLINNLRYSGQYFDGETGLHQNWYREYAPAIGRYAQPDPVTLGMPPIESSYWASAATQLSMLAAPTRQRVYPYALNNPIGTTDPDGRAPKPWYASQCVWRQLTTAFRDGRNSGLPGRTNGPQDALRHCTGICLISKNCGSSDAFLGGTSHEVFTKDPIDSRVMDLHSNAIGRRCADLSCRCDSCCLGAVRSGELTWLPPSRWTEQ